MKARLIIAKIIAAILAFSMFVAIGDQDYYYYILLRERIFFYGIFMGVLLIIDRESFEEANFVLLGLGIAIFLWNPINTITLERSLWQILNGIFGLFFGFITLLYGNILLLDR